MHQEGLRHRAKRLAEKFAGVSISRQSKDFDATRNHLIKKLEPDLIIDCGANSGQWGLLIKKFFPDSNLLSYEPLSSPFKRLEFNSQNYKKWQAMNFALSSFSGSTVMNIASNEGLSSSLTSPSLHVEVHPKISFSESENVTVARLDDFDLTALRIYLKMDVQGHEDNVLSGAVKTLRNVIVVEIESSFTPLYECETPHHKLISKLLDLGFVPYCFGNVHKDNNGRIWQLDTILVRSEYLQ